MYHELRIVDLFLALLREAAKPGAKQCKRYMGALQALHGYMLCRDTVQLYEQLRESGLQYGPAFRLLRNVHVPDTQQYT